MNDEDDESIVTLANGVVLPKLGFGTGGLSAGREMRSVVRKAVEAGYRLLEISPSYGNEEDVGSALLASEIPREEMFIISSLQTNLGRVELDGTIERSLCRLNTDYVDLLFLSLAEEDLELWGAAQELSDDGKVLAMGVYEPSTDLIGDLMRKKAPPVAVQMELHPHRARSDIRNQLGGGVVTVACSPLKRGAMVYDRAMAGVGWRFRKTAVQATLRWAFQHGFVTVARTRWKKRMEENLDVLDFPLSREDMRTIDSLDGYCRRYNE